MSLVPETSAFYAEPSIEYTETDLKAIQGFLGSPRTNFRTKYHWCRKNAAKVGIAIRLAEKFAEKSGKEIAITRQYLSEYTGLKPGYVKSSIEELRALLLIEPTHPYRTAQHFDSYMGRLLRTAKTSELLE